MDVAEISRLLQVQRANSLGLLREVVELEAIIEFRLTGVVDSGDGCQESSPLDLDAMFSSPAPVQPQPITQSSSSSSHIDVRSPCLSANTLPHESHSLIGKCAEPSVFGRWATPDLMLIDEDDVPVAEAVCELAPGPPGLLDPFETQGPEEPEEVPPELARSASLERGAIKEEQPDADTASGQQQQLPEELPEPAQQEELPEAQTASGPQPELPEGLPEPTQQSWWDHAGQPEALTSTPAPDAATLGSVVYLSTMGTLHVHDQWPAVEGGGGHPQQLESWPQAAQQPWPWQPEAPRWSAVDTDDGQQDESGLSKWEPAQGADPAGVEGRPKGAGQHNKLTCNCAVPAPEGFELGETCPKCQQVFRVRNSHRRPCKGKRMRVIKRMDKLWAKMGDQPEMVDTLVAEYLDAPNKLWLAKQAHGRLAYLKSQKENENKQVAEAEVQDEAKVQDEGEHGDEAASSALHRQVDTTGAE